MAFDRLALPTWHDLPVTSGNWQRPPDEYVRPRAVLDLEAYCPTLADADEWFASATWFHQENLRLYSHGVQVTVELVPEPSNRFDRRAVALDIDGQRCGYMPSSTAERWHDVVAGLTRSGFAVTVGGAIDHRWIKTWAGGDVPVLEIGLVISVPEHEDRIVLAELAGLRAQHDLVVSHLTEDERAEMAEDCWSEYSERLARRLRKLSDFAPGLRWGPKTDELPERVPYWHHAFVRNDVTEARDRAKALRAVRRAVRRRIKLIDAAQRAEARAAAEAARALKQAEAKDLLLAGLGASEVTRRTGVSSSTLSRLRREAGVAPVDPATVNAGVAAARIERAHIAYQFRQEGLDRASICRELGLDIQAVKELIADGKFYGDPAGNPERMALALRAAELRASGIVKEEVLAAMEVSRNSALRAFRDCQVPGLLPEGR